MSGFTGGLKIKVKQVTPPKIQSFRAEELMFDSFVEQAIDKIKARANSPEMSSWLVQLVSEERKPFAVGGYKRLYQVGGMAISVEVGPKAFVKRREYILPKVREALRFLPLSQQKVILGVEWEEIPVNDQVSVLFSRLDLCEMNVWEFIEQMRGKPSPANQNFYGSELLSLVLSLHALHDEGMYLLDIKPENMLLCNGSIYWSDVEDLVFLTDETIVPTLSVGYSFEIYKELLGLEFLQSELRGLKLSMVDWFAFSRSIHDFPRMLKSVERMPAVRPAFHDTFGVVEILGSGYQFGKTADQIRLVNAMVRVVKGWEAIAEAWAKEVRIREAGGEMMDVEEKTRFIEQENGENGEGLKF